MIGFVTGALFSLAVAFVSFGMMAGVAASSGDNSVEAWTVVLTLVVVGGALGTVLGLSI